MTTCRVLTIFMSSSEEEVETVLNDNQADLIDAINEESGVPLVYVAMGGVGCACFFLSMAILTTLFDGNLTTFSLYSITRSSSAASAAAVSACCLSFAVVVVALAFLEACRFRQIGKRAFIGFVGVGVTATPLGVMAAPLSGPYALNPAAVVALACLLMAAGIALHRSMADPVSSTVQVRHKLAFVAYVGALVASLLSLYGRLLHGKPLAATAITGNCLLTVCMLFYLACFYSELKRVKLHPGYYSANSIEL